MNLECSFGVLHIWLLVAFGIKVGSIQVERAIFTTGAMGVDSFDQFVLLVLLLGAAMGAIGVLVLQRLCWVMSAVPNSKKAASIAKKNDDDLCFFKGAKLPAELFLSTTERVHKTSTCSGMKSPKKVKACTKCFKIM